MLRGKDFHPISCMALGAQVACSSVAGTSFLDIFLVTVDNGGGAVGVTRRMRESRIAGR